MEASNLDTLLKCIGIFSLPKNKSWEQISVLLQMFFLFISPGYLRVVSTDHRKILSHGRKYVVCITQVQTFGRPSTKKFYGPMGQFTLENWQAICQFNSGVARIWMKGGCSRGMGEGCSLPTRGEVWGGGCVFPSSAENFPII